MTTPPSTSAAAQALRAAGLRVTAPRLAVLDELLQGGHVGAEQLTMTVRARLGTVSTQAVYDVLHVLVAAGLAARIEPAGSPAARFEARTGDNHHHVVCRSCGRVADVDCAVGAAPCLEPSTAHGYRIEQAEVTYWGTCPACQANSQSPLEGVRS